MAARPERIVLTYEDLADLPEDGNRYEIYEGELEVTAAPVPRHQRVVGKLFRRLSTHVEKHDLGEVLIAPMDVKFSDVAVVEPDLIFVSQARTGIIGERFIAGAPDLVVEVLSPSTATRDRRTKRSLYARYEVPHYWLFDPDARTAEALELVGSRYRLGARASEDESFTARPFPDLAISLADVWVR